MWEFAPHTSAALLALLLFLTASQASSVGWSYAVIIDAGSTGSRAHVFRYYTHGSSSGAGGGAAGNEASTPWASVELPCAAHKTSPGLSSLAFDPRTAASSLKPLVKFAQDKVPHDQWASTPVQLMATAGMRLLPNGTAEAVLAAVRQLLGGSGFLFSPTWVRVVDGVEEGLWGWVAANYMTGALQALSSAALPPQLLGRKDAPAPAPKPAAPLMGLLELGGGSMQVTFAVDKHIPEAHEAALHLPGLGKQLWSHSFDGLGLQSAMSRLETTLVQAANSSSRSGIVSHPCLPSGYVSTSGLRGAGSWDSCVAAVRQLLPKEACSFSSCAIGNVFMPTPSGSFLGTDNFFYTARSLGLPAGDPSNPLRLKDLEAGGKKFCAKSWGSIRSEFLRHSKGSDTYLTRVCFGAALISVLLRDGLKMDAAATQLRPSNSVPTPKGGTVEVNWALGALLVEVLQAGGKALGGVTAGDAHAATPGAAPKPSTAMSAVEAAAAAATAVSAAVHSGHGAAGPIFAVVFCLVLIALMVMASMARVGVIVRTPDRGGRPALSRLKAHATEADEAQVLIVNAAAEAQQMVALAQQQQPGVTAASTARRQAQAR